MDFNEKELAVYVGSKIREYRKKKKMTQKEFGKLIGKKDNTISNYETGTISPDQDALFTISRALGVTVDDLFPSTKESNNYKPIEHALKVAEISDIEYEDMMLIKKIAEKALTLEGEERKRLMNSIKLAYEFFENSK